VLGAPPLVLPCPLAPAVVLAAPAVLFMLALPAPPSESLWSFPTPQPATAKSALTQASE
jgi:hypothetical protein